MEAFIACMTPAGPSANRPPHSGLDCPLRAVIALLLLLGACDAAPSDAGSQPHVASLGKVDRSHAGTPAPVAVFVLGDARGQAVTLAGFRGRRVLVNLWATWCAPCVHEMPALNAFAAKSGGRLTVLAISQDMDGWRAVDKFFRPGRFPALRPALDAKLAWAGAVGAAGLPVSILYDEQGREVWRVPGDFPWDGADLPALVAG